MTIKAVKNGFTFIEMILYLALAAMVIGILFAYGWNIISINTKSTTLRETIAGSRLVTERLKREIRSANDVDKDNSVFDHIPGKITLDTDEGKVVIEADGDKISIKRGDATADFLHSEEVRIKDFLLTDEVSSDGKIRYVGFSFDAESHYPAAGNRFEYQYSFLIKSGAEIRSNN
jgi:hypothetical protein